MVTIVQSSTLPTSISTTGTGLTPGILTLKTPSTSYTLQPVTTGVYSSPTSGFATVPPGAYSISGAREERMWVLSDPPRSISRRC